MSLSAKLRRAPQRAVTGAFILGSGLQKLSADEARAKGMHDMASGSYGFVAKLDPKLFTKLLAVGEIGLGALVLAPVVSPVVAGAGLVGFSGALLNMWWNTPGMHEEGSIKPTPAGIPIAKDAWMLGIGVSLMADGLLEPPHDKKIELGAVAAEKRAEKGRRARKAAKKAKRANRDLLEQARATAKDARAAAKEAQAEAGKRAQKAAKKANKRVRAAADQARDAAQQARDAAQHAADEYGPVVAGKAKAARDATRDAAQHAAERAQAAVH